MLRSAMAATGSTSMPTAAQSPASALVQNEVRMAARPRELDLRPSRPRQGRGLALRELLEVRELRRAHGFAELVVAPGPHRRDPARIEVPAAAAGAEHGLARGLRAFGVEARGGLGAGADLAASAALHARDQLHDVVELQLRHLDQREVA